MTMIEKKEDVCLLNSATTHSILKDKNYFSTMTLRKANVHTISGHVEMIDGRAQRAITPGLKILKAPRPYLKTYIHF